MTELALHSAAFADHDMLPRRLSRPGGNVTPSLRWSDPPDGTEELVLLCEDPDAGPEPFLHWLVTGIDPVARGTGEGEEPPGGRPWPNGFGTTGWAGPQPPPGDDPHRYVFRLYALPAPPDLPPRPRVPDVHRAVDGVALASGALIGRFAD